MNEPWTYESVLMKENTSHLIDQQEYIDQIRSCINETDTIANEISIELPQQGETIRRQMDQTIRIGDTVQHARTSIGRMSRWSIIQSIVLVCVIFTMIFIICIIFFFVMRSYYLKWNAQ